MRAMRMKKTTKLIEMAKLSNNYILLYTYSFNLLSL